MRLRHRRVLADAGRDHQRLHRRCITTGAYQNLEHVVERRGVGAAGWITGLMLSMNGSSAAEASRVSWLFIQLMLPVTVLISPLCASMRNGCASFQVGNVLVE